MAASDRPLVTIGLPLYNGAAFLPAALADLQAQTYPSIEIVISDNASTDDTQRICREAAAADPRIRYERSPTNHGLAWNFRRVLEMGEGEYFMYAPFDDRFATEYIERCVDRLEADPTLSYVFAQNILIDVDGRRIGTEAVRQRLASPSPDVRFWDMLVVQGGMNFYGIARRTMFERVGPYRAVSRGERIILVSLTLWGSFDLLPGELYFRRIHGGQVTAIRRDRRAEMRVIDPERGTSTAAITLMLVEYVYAYIEAALRAPLSIGQRIRVLGRIGRWVIGHVPPFGFRDPRAKSPQIDREGPGELPDGRAGIGY